MKKLLLLIPLFLLAFTSKYTPDLNNFIQPVKCDRVLHKKAFDICYSCKYKHPWAVAYELKGDLVKYKKVEVITGTCGNNGYIKNGVGIPTHWYKIIYIPKTNNYIAFLAPNTNTGMSRAKLKEYKTTLKDIKQVCEF
jgi:DNA/RNA endonuclease G (NUC1)